MFVKPAGVFIEQLRWKARPTIPVRIAHYPRPNRIKFNLLTAGQEVPLRLNRTGLITSAPERPAAALKAIDMPRLTTGQTLHQITQCSDFIWGLQNQVNMVRHQTIRGHLYAVFTLPNAKRIKIGLIATGLSKNDLPMVPALYDVVRMG